MHTADQPAIFAVAEVYCMTINPIHGGIKILNLLIVYIVKSSTPYTEQKIKMLRPEMTGMMFIVVPHVSLGAFSPIYRGAINSMLQYKIQAL